MNKVILAGGSRLIVYLVFLFISTALTAQNAIIRGFVYEKETGEPILFTNVYLLGTTYGSTTDINGYFAITQIPPGNYTLMVTYLGYDTLRVDLTLKPNDLVQKNLYLVKSTVLLKEIYISAERQAVQTETRTSVVKVTPIEIKQIPNVGGKADIAQYLQVLPGVIFTGDQGGQLYIRGGSPIQNKVILDGMVIYNPFHSIGLFSVFDTETIRIADIYTGGFNAEYGGRISSVMDITTRDGNRKNYTGKVGISTFGASALVEGPIKKQSEQKGSSSSFLLSAKNSYLEQTSRLFYKYANEDGLPFNFVDFYGKLSLNAENGSKVNLFGFNFNDWVNYNLISDYSWSSTGGGARFVIIPGRTPVLMEGIFAYSSYEMQLREKNRPPRQSSVNGFNAGLDFTYFHGKNEMKYGVEMNGFKTDFSFFNDLGHVVGQEQNTTELAGFFKYKATAGKFLIEPGLRLQWYASLSDFSFEPRLAMKYNFRENTRFKLAAGLYSQNLITARSERDVVDLFYGFLSGPDQTLYDFDGKQTPHKLQKAEHLIIGLEQDIHRHITINLEGYYKHFPQLTNLNRYKLYDAASAPPGTPYQEYADFIIEKGESSGIDLTLKYSQKGIYFWTAYSFAFVNRYDGRLWYFPHFDRRHNLNVLFAYTFGEIQQWEISSRWNFGTGFPFTQSQGYYEKILFTGGINSNYMIENGILGIEYGELNKGRLPTYHRLDVNLRRTFFFTERSHLQADLSVTNIYNRPNVFYVNRTTGEVIRQLPVMPSLGLTFTF